MKPRNLIGIGAGLLGVTLLAGGTPATGAPSGPNPGDFVHPKSNPYFPLTPGLVTHLRGSDGNQHFREVVRVTRRTTVVDGIRCHVIRDVLHRRDGSLAERTRDWDANDNDGNVWYFGERTATYHRDGSLGSREGSWRAGVDGARPGKIMPADPRPTLAYRQEYQRGVAEDQAWIVQRGMRRTVPAGRYRQVVRSLEWSRLEPGVVSQKFYAPGVGIIAEKDVAGGHETFVLTSVHQG
jgi:hypothetical protein